MKHRFVTCLLGLMLIALGITIAEAAVYELTVGPRPPCDGVWSVSGTVYTCSGRVTLATNDSLIATTAGTLRANNGVLMDTAVIGSSNVRINIYSPAFVSLGRFSTVYGNIDANSVDASGNSLVEGTCRATKITPTKLCRVEVVDPTPPEPPPAQFDHIRLEYAQAALTCNPLAVRVRACIDAACSVLFQDPVTVTLLPNTGWLTGTQVTLSGGQATVALRRNTPGDVVLGVSSSTVATTSSSSPVCSTAGCRVSFAESGFLFDVPTLTAAKPQADIAFRAVKADPADPQQCKPGFADGAARTVQFSSVYATPSTGTQPVVVNGVSVGGIATNVSLVFDSEAVARLTVRYDDAGQMTLNARYAPASGSEAGLVMVGSDQFVSKPYGLCIQTVATAEQACTADSISCPLFRNGTTVVRAGDPVPVTFRAVGWQFDGEALTADQLCTGNITTPNFQLAGIALSSQLTAPASGGVGTLGAASYNHSLGNTTALQQTFSEVGIFRLVAAPPRYFGEAISGGTSNRIGRFSPAYLDVVGSASLTPSCSVYSYQGQPIAFATGREPSLIVAGKNRQGQTTTNYDRGGFWQLALPALGSYASVVGLPNLDSRLTASGTATVAVAGADDGDGMRTYRWSGQALTYAPAVTPSNDDLKFVAKVRHSFSAASLTDLDGACFGNGSACSTLAYDFTDAPGSEVRLGRLQIGNALGSELQPLALPLTIQSWQATAAGPAFLPEPQDICTTAGVIGTPLLEGFTGNLVAGKTIASTGSFSQGAGLVSLTAPGAGNDGSLQLAYPNMPEWLKYDWLRSGSRQPARGVASFGIYQGAKPLIFRRELYR